jgi:alkaline phosphatase D
VKIRHVPIVAFIIILASTAASALAPPTRDALFRAAASGETQPGLVLSEVHFPQSVASGDPREGSVILWTRLVDEARPGEDLSAMLFVGRDLGGGRFVLDQHVPVIARAKNGHAIKQRVAGLLPGTTYHYVFAYPRGGSWMLSPLGRTRTAPAAGSNEPVRFAFVNCQDYIGRYYNSHLQLIERYADEIDFVVSLGDYIYETTGDPDFQTSSPDRAIVFDDQENAIQLGDPDNPFFGAASLDNYRQIYRTYRSDPVMKRLHELFPMIVIWDDHEYSDDSHGTTATFFDGRREESDVTRRQNAERAFFEYVPNEIGLDASGALEIDASVLYPNTRIYRDFSFGETLDLVLTDYRTYRPDHTVPEDAFPGGLALERIQLEAILGEQVYQAIKASFDPYVDIEEQPELRDAALMIFTQIYLLGDPSSSVFDAAARADTALRGNVSATYLNAVFTGVGLPQPIADEQLPLLDAGLSYLLLGKRDVFANIGSRYILPKEAYELLANYLYVITGAESENVYGLEQERWLRRSVSESDAAWRVVGSSVAHVPLVLDFTNPVIEQLLPPEFPDAFRTRLLVNADHWDGFPNKRRSLLQAYADKGNTLLISGDIHASFLTDHGEGVFEMTGTSVSSESFRKFVLERVESDPLLAGVPGIEALVDQIDPILQISVANPEVSPATIAYANTLVNGFVVVEATSENVDVTFWHIPADFVFESYYEDPAALDGLFDATRFRIENGSLVPSGE